MPATTAKQARTMRAAAHGADFPAAKKIRASMSPKQIAEFSHTKAEGPSHSYNWRSRRNLKRGKA